MNLGEKLDLFCKAPRVKTRTSGQIKWKLTQHRKSTILQQKVVCFENKQTKNRNNGMTDFVSVEDKIREYEKGMGYFGSQ